MVLFNPLGDVDREIVLKEVSDSIRTSHLAGVRSVDALGSGAGSTSLSAPVSVPIEGISRTESDEPVVSATDTNLVPVMDGERFVAFARLRVADALGAGPTRPLVNFPSEVQLRQYAVAKAHVEERFDEQFTAALIEYRPLHLKAFHVVGEGREVFVVFQASHRIIPNSSLPVEFERAEFFRLISLSPPIEGLSE